MPAKNRPAFILGLIAYSAFGLQIHGVKAAPGKDFLKQDQLLNKQNQSGSQKENLVKLQPPPELKIRAKSQRYDAKRGLFVAEGAVKITLNGGILLADIIEFDVNFNTLYARGSVRFQKGQNYFQASSLRYNLVQKTGELQDVYGVLDLESPVYSLSSFGIDTFKPLSSKKENISKEPSSSSEGLKEEKDSKDLSGGNLEEYSSQLIGQNSINTFEPKLACPAELPPVPDWQPHEWAVTGWGGEMIDSSFGDTFIFNGRLRREYLWGIGLQKRIYRSGIFSLELETDIFGHNSFKDRGGKYNQSVPNTDLDPQTFGEGVLGIGARLWLRPWLSFAITEGISYYSQTSNYERTFRKKNSKLLNYLAFEIEVATSKNLSLVGRIHHRSGAFGLYNGAHGGGNGYLLGLRYRWDEKKKPFSKIKLNPPLGCKGYLNKSLSAKPKLLDELDLVSMGDGSFDSNTNNFPQIKYNEEDKPIATDLKNEDFSSLSIYQQEDLRTKAIIELDQRINDISFKQAFKLEKRLGVPKSARTRELQEEKEFGRVKPYQLLGIGRIKFVSGKISRWRVQASKVILRPNGWFADRMGFTNDPFTPAQARVDAEGVVAIEEDGRLLITSQSNRLVLDDRLPIPVSRRRKFDKEEEIENRWAFGFDYEDRDGFFIGRNLKERKLGKNFKLSMQPQINLERAIKGRTKSYVSKDNSISQEKITQDLAFLDTFALESNVSGKIGGWGLELNSDISTFNSENFLNGSRFWGDLSKSSYFPILGEVETQFFSTYRYRAWNGSLGETDIYTAYGAFLQKSGNFDFGSASNNYLVRLGGGRYQAEKASSLSIYDLWRGNLYASLSTTIPIWRGETAPLTSYQAYRYSPTPIIPGVDFNTNTNTSLSIYGDGKQQNTLGFSGGPSFTIGRFDKPLLSYSRFSIMAGGTLKQGNSPFSFDQAIDLGTLGIGITQQIYGPLLFDAGFEYNIDPASENYGSTIDSNLEIRFQRRAYDFGLYYNPYRRLGGFRIRLNDFNFKGTGVPFIPYSPEKITSKLEDRPY